ALLLKGDGTKALDTSGSLTLSGAGFANATATAVRVQYNSTGVNFGAAPQAITVGDINGGTLTMAAGTAVAPLLRLGVTGLQVTVGGVLTAGGNFEFEKVTTQKGTTVIKAVTTNFHVTLGDGSTDYVVLQQGPTDFGALMITDTGVAGRITVGL